MIASDDNVATATGAVVRKFPKKEAAMGERILKVEALEI
jgi:hypothetical protein